MSPNPQLFAQFLVPSFPAVPSPHVSSSLVIPHLPHCPITPPPAVILTITYVLCPNNTQFPHPLLPPTHFHSQLQNLTDLSKPPFSSSLLIHHQVLGSAPWESAQDLLSQQLLLRCPTQRPPLAILQATAAPAQSQPRGHTSPIQGCPLELQLHLPPPLNLPCVPRGSHQCKHGVAPAMYKALGTGDDRGSAQPSGAPSPA